MEKNYIRANSLIELEFVTLEGLSETHYHENFELLFLLNGSLTVVIEEEAFVMRPKDIIVINADRKHSCEGMEGTLAGRFMISYNKCELCPRVTLNPNGTLKKHQKTV